MLAAFACVVLAITVFGAPQGMSRMLSVEPESGKVGDELTISGENLDKKSVPEIYFTNGSKDIALPITSQSVTQIKFKIPSEAKPGRYTLMLLTSGNDPKMIEQALKVTVN